MSGKKNSHYQQSLFERTEAEFATGHISAIESGTCKDEKREGWRAGGREGGMQRRKSETEGGAEREREMKL